VKPEQTLFIDDREANVETAIALGIYAIKYQSVPQLAANLKALQCQQQFKTIPSITPFTER